MTAAYWQQAFEVALDEMGLDHLLAAMTAEQRAEMGEALNGSHECYSMAYYSPPASDRISEIERELKAKLKAAEADAERYRDGAEKAIKRALRQYSDAQVTITPDGEVFRHGGRTEQIL